MEINGEISCVDGFFKWGFVIYKKFEFDNNKNCYKFFFILNVKI